MKKRFRIPIIGLICCLLLGTIAFRSQGPQDHCNLWRYHHLPERPETGSTDVNGKVVEPLIYQGTTYVPIRAVSEWLGKTVTWQGSTSSVFINDSVFSDNEVAAAENVISEFFTLFGDKQYQKMAALCTGDAAGFDYSSGVFGMKEAKLKSCTYNGDYSAREKKLVFECSFAMKPAANSVYDPNQTSTTCLIYVKKVGSQFLIDEFASGF